MNDFRNPPGQYDPHVHKQRHEEKQKMGAGSLKEVLWDLVSLLIALGIMVLIFCMFRFFF
ncbi:hypothetical protein DMN77_10675 [Paenibacillus sp. 79R4]|uniref:hypothetical protein n=1 Tax=Paenibacillus sp. 79R4 TaxID=2212847 RepID=UPI0015B97925|nr:hypothetical protein [Paenibacillus sp. 79R4]NWL88052.1 hypothetical protein [Paenibacillus sp. 79R4]